MRRGRLATVVTFLLAAVAAAGDEPTTALARGKVEADLGNQAAAAVAFASVLRSQEATPSQRWEALIRQGVAERESGKPVDAVSSFEEAFRIYGKDPEALRFLVQALGGALPGEERWEEIWHQVALDVDRRDPEHPVARIRWPGVEPSLCPCRGTAISLDFKNADYQEVFRLFADVSGMNVVVQPGTQGRISYRCVERPWDEVLEQILAPYGFVARIQGNVVWIGRPEEAGARRSFAGKAISVKFESEPLAAVLQEVASNGAATVDLAPGVKGRVTLELHEVPWDQAFDLLARVNGLTWTRSGKVLHVVPRKR